MQLKPIDEQVVVIMGASSGIGRQTALHFAQRGAKVLVAARGAQALNSLVNEIESNGGTAKMVVADTSDYEQVQLVANTAVAEFGRVDTWVQNAGIFLVARFEDTTAEELRRIIEVNLIGASYGIKVALPLVGASEGSLIVTSSVEADVAIPLHAAYAASKHGLKGLIDALRVELKNDKRQVNLVNIQPATIDTPLWSNGKTKIGVRPGAPGPIYSPNVVADAILFAAENPAREIKVGGGAALFAGAERLSPPLTDRMLMMMIPETYNSEEAKTADAPNNFYEPSNDSRTFGDYHRKSRAWSLETWLATHPRVRNAAAGALLGVLAMAALRRAS